MDKKNEGHKKGSSRLSKLYLSFMSVVIMLKAGQAGFPFPGGEINVVFLKREGRFRGPSSIKFSGYRRPTLGLKQPRREADHSLSFSEDIKNE